MFTMSMSVVCVLPPVHIQQARPMMIPHITTAVRDTLKSSLPVACNTAREDAQRGRL